MKKSKRLLALLLVLTLCLAMLPGVALAADDEDTSTESSKTVTVGSGQTYTTIQTAINYIAEQSDKTEWTIIVESGNYKRFTVLSGLDGLTIQAADNANVTISTWDGTESESGSVPKKQESYYLYNGIYIMSQNVTLKGLTINVGWDVDVSEATTLRTGLSDFDLPNSSCWYVAGIRTTNADSADGLVIDTCNFTSSIQGDDSNTNYGILTACYSFTVKNSTFDGFWQGISVMGDYYAVDDVSITQNTFTGCNRAISIYYKVAPEDTSNMGTLSITNNVIVGSSDVRSKIILHDVSSNGSMGNVTLSGNKFSYGFVLIVNFAESPDTINGKTVASGEAKSAVFADNTWAYGSFYVESSEYYNSSTGYTGTISADYPELAYYEAPESDTGYWVLNTDLDSSPYTGTYANPEGTTEYVQSVIAAANAAGSHTLSFTFDDEEELIWTLTAFKDAIYWVSGEMPTEKTSEPGMDKVIIEGNEEKENTTAAAGDVIDFELRSTIPEDMKTYIQEAAEAPQVVDEDGETTTPSYVMTFHDVMDEELVLNESSIKVTITTYEINEAGQVVATEETKTIDDQYYDVLTGSEVDDNCTFEVVVDLLSLYTNGVITDKDLGSADIVVSYSATLSENASAGTYTNTAWVVWPEGKSAEDTVTVDTYDIRIFKYDQSATDDEGNYVGLAGATFELRLAVEEGTEGASSAEDKDGNTYYYDVISSDLLSGDDGYAKIEGLDAGTYYLVETKAPEGYVKSNEALQIVIPGSNTTKNVVSVEFANAPIPSTGGMGTTLFTYGGLALILAAGVVFVLTRRRRAA